MGKPKQFDVTQLSPEDQAAYQNWQQQFQAYLDQNRGAIPAGVSYAQSHPEYLKEHPELQQGYDLLTGAGLSPAVGTALKGYHTSWTGGQAGQTKNKGLWSHPETYAQLILGGALGGVAAAPLFAGGAGAAAGGSAAAGGGTAAAGGGAAAGGTAAAGAGTAAAGTAAAGGGTAIGTGLGVAPSLAGSTAAGAGFVAGGVGTTATAAGAGGGLLGAWNKYGPLATQVGGAVAGGLASRAAEQGALKRSPEEEAALRGARGAAQGQQEQAGNLFNAASGLTGQGKQWLEQPANYYKTLLSGNRAAQANALAAPTAAITDTYRGAERNLERSGVRGAARDVAAGELGRQRASQIAGLHTGVQNEAAGSLAKLGEAGLNSAAPLYGAGAQLSSSAGNIYGNLLTSATFNRTRAMDEGNAVGREIGGFVRDTLPMMFPAGSGTAPMPTTPSRQLPQPTTPGSGGRTPRPPITPLPRPQQLPYSPPTTASRPIGTGMGTAPAADWWR